MVLELPGNAAVDIPEMVVLIGNVLLFVLIGRGAATMFRLQSNLTIGCEVTVESGLVGSVADLVSVGDLTKNLLSSGLRQSGLKELAYFSTGMAGG